MTEALSEPRPEQVDVAEVVRAAIEMRPPPAGSIACMVAGYRAIRRRRIERHRAFMVAAAATSAGFMILFVTRFAWFGFAPYGGGGAGNVLYYVVLLIHEPLAVINIPLVLVALVLGLRRSSAHREVARPALLVWLVAASTGVLLYALLYSWLS